LKSILSGVEYMAEGINKTCEKKIKEFEHHLVMEELEDSTIKGQMRILRMFCKNIDKHINDISKTDIQNYFTKIRPSLGYKDTINLRTTSHEKLILSKFFKWLGKKDMVDIKRKKNDKQRVFKTKEVLSPTEVKKLINSTRCLRDKAMFTFMADTGCRVGELVKMLIEDIDFNHTPALASLDGKTGIRNVPMRDSGTIVKNYIEFEHPHKDDKSSPLWINYDVTNKKYKAIYPQHIWWLMKQSAKRAGIEKRVYPHLLRHTKATELAKRKLPEYLMNRFFGWSDKSHMSAIYVHGTQADLIDALNRAYGEKKTIELEPSPLKDIDCPRCHEKNPASYSFCSKCNYPLTTEASMHEVAILELLRSDLYKDLLEMAREDGEFPNIETWSERYQEMLKASRDKKRKKVPPKQ